MSDNQIIQLSNVVQYFKIAERSCHNSIKYTDLTKSLSYQETNEFDNELVQKKFDDIIKFGSLAREEAITSVVFSSMTLEAFINEYGINKSGKNYFSNNLDKLSLESKFLIIPKLFGTTFLNPENHEFEQLKWLIKLRNDLVHFKKKSRNIKDIKMINPLKQKDFITSEHAVKSIEVVKSIIKILDFEIYNGFH